MKSATESEASKPLSGVLRTGTGAGILVALAVLAVFILAATFLKALFFGLILACFFLPLEKFFERKFFQWPWVRALCSVWDRLGRPFQYLKWRIAGGKIPSPEEQQERARRKLIARSCLAAALTFLSGILLVLILIGGLLIPAALSAGRKIKESLPVQCSLARLENSLSDNRETSAKNSAEAVAEPAAPSADKPGESRFTAAFRELVGTLRRTLPEYIRQHHGEAAKLAFSGRNMVSTLVMALLSMISVLGTFAFDLLLGTFFFFFFLQQLAAFMSGTGEHRSIGSWCVRGLFRSRWMPSVSRNTRMEAVTIIDWIVEMFVKWIRGYLWIIIIETLLYLIGFSLSGVPSAPFLALIAGLTILLPFLGPLASYLLTAVFCLAFCSDHTVGTLIGASVTYLVINGILEQFLLYPRLIGNALDLSTIETIVAVLLGGFVAGIPGMIFAVPAAAVLKYLIPRIYRVVRRSGR